MRINNLIIETTRRCQLECLHCLRGDSRQIDLEDKYLTELLTGVDSIGIVTFTGGEPFLNVGTIKRFIEYIKWNKIELDSFYIATNGLVTRDSTQLSKECLMACIELYCMSNDKEMCQVQISEDVFHDCEIKDSNLLFGLGFTSTRGESLTRVTLIPEGRGEVIAVGVRQKPEPEIDWEYPDEIEVYLNAEGRVCWDCDLSYETQDEYSVSIKEAKLTIKKINEKINEEWATVSKNYA